MLEDSLIDLELEVGRLVLERDIPLVPGPAKALLYWPLDQEAQALAKQQRIKLSTLMDVMKPAKTPRELAAEAKRERMGEPPSKSLVRILGVDFDGIDVELAFVPPTDGAPIVQQVNHQIWASGGVRARGSLHFRAASEPVAAPGALHVRLDELCLVANEIRVNGARLTGTLCADTDELTVRVDPKLRAVSLRSPRIVLSDMSLAVTDA
jgi:hypothetical protein